MGGMIRFAMTGEAVDVEGLRGELVDPGAGAVVMFDGRVRDRNEGREVVRLEYQAYGVLAERVGERILREEAERHGLLGAVAVHRTGVLEVGEVAVWAGVSAGHRGAAFDGARAILERLKFELPVWKRETYVAGDSGWVGPDARSPETGLANDVPEWRANLLDIVISPGHDFRGRHGEGRMEHGVVRLEEVECVAGMGLRGDRYFGYKPDFKGQVTFFDADVLDELRVQQGRPDLDAALFRRNLLVRGVDLTEWVGRRFRFQGVTFEGSEACKPCYWMNEAVGPGTESALEAGCRGGLRARILSDGVLRVGEGVNTEKLKS